MKNQGIMMAFDRRYENFWKNNKVDSSSLVGDLGIGNMKERKKQEQKNKANEIWWHLEFGLGFPLKSFIFFFFFLNQMH